MDTVSPDANVEKNRQLLLERSIVGFKKYGVTTERTDLSPSDWAQHALEEVLDLANYLQALRTSLAREPASASVVPPRTTEVSAALEWLNVVATSEDGWYPQDMRHAQVLQNELNRLKVKCNEQ